MPAIVSLFGSFFPFFRLPCALLLLLLLLLLLSCHIPYKRRGFWQTRCHDSVGNTSPGLPKNGSWVERPNPVIDPGTPQGGHPFDTFESGRHIALFVLPASWYNQ